MTKKYLLAWEERTLLLACSICIFLCILPHTMSIPIMPSIIKNLNSITIPNDPSSGTITQEKLIEFLFIGNLVGTPFTGWISDSWGSRLYPLLISLAMMFFGNLVTAYGEQYPLPYLCARFAIGISIGSIWVLIMAIMADIFPTKNEETKVTDSKLPIPMVVYCSSSKSLSSTTLDEFTNNLIDIKRNVRPIYFGFAMGIVSAFYGLGAAIGPKFSVILTKLVSPKSPSLFCAFLSFFLIICFIIVNPDHLSKILSANKTENKKYPREEEVVKRIRLRDILSNPQIIAALGLTILSGCNSGTVQVKISNWLSKQDSRRFDPDGLANWLFWVIIPNIVVTVLLGDFIDRDYIPLGIISIIGLFGNSIFMSLIPEIKFVYLFSILFGVTIPLLTSPIIPILSISIKRMSSGGGGNSHNNAFGLIFSLYNTASNIGNIIGPMMLPTIENEHTDIKRGLYYLASISIIYIPIYIFIIRGKFISISSSCSSLAVVDENDSLVVVDENGSIVVVDQ